MNAILPVGLHAVTFRYGRRAVLAGVDLEIAAGEWVGIVGANGSGKTTLFSVLVGLLQPDSGERSFAGRVVEGVDETIRGRFGFVGHRPQLYPGLTARENLSLFAGLRSVAGAGRPARVTGEQWLERLGLDAVVFDRPVHTFSRGMAQRVALARALAHRPGLLVLDEPFTALDGAGRSAVVAALDAARQDGAAVLVSTHDVRALSEYADRAVHLHGGRIVAEATSDVGEDAFRAKLEAFVVAPRVQVQ